MAEIYPLHQSCQLPTEDQATPSSMVSVRVDGHDAKLQSTVYKTPQKGHVNKQISILYPSVSKGPPACMLFLNGLGVTR